ncbi:MAG: hypothetical protein R2867_33325 [Caldilineaceae bacterium]
MLHVAEVLGSPVMRTLLGSNADRRTETPVRPHMLPTPSALRICA